MENGFSEGYAVGRDSSNSGSNNGWGEWIWILVIFALLGWGNNGGYGGCQGGALTRSDLCSDMNFNSLAGSVRGIANGICDSTFALNNTIVNGNAAAQNTMTQGFAGLNTAIITNGYEDRLATNTLAQQMASCCCDLRAGQVENKYANLQNTQALQSQISSCCCENEKAIMNINYNMATQNCATLQAIDKLGDRIIDYMCANEKQALRDENQALRLAASQSKQNAYLIDALAPKAPIPAYPVFPTTSFAYPSGVTFGVNGNNGCACSCGNV